ncbi:glycoside hydrolase family 53 protein [Paractinoplanes atraurantiacus]|uniref:Arabinogalactan endo-beta-1,4-galactanase n=1 Tax=Paractinoplanes atraurantiacus TaxID=1036182 RepID=A0A285KGD5_9ACTN|nr:glycosyl hydrolase 53 family protein [Actinoplanes atraurantiacus]SNY71658.1 arabinogalactan endo-1,4-beta-galactosidase [Actinoplanes atraurantiacus]
MSFVSRRTLLAGAGGAALAAITPGAASAASATTRALSVRGADLSFLPQLEEAGVRYRDLAGRVRPAEQILAREGATHMRLRVWVDPPDGYSDKARALHLARRAKKAGLQIVLDPHYSDFWADPGKQPIPASWPKDLPGLVRKIRSYTRDLLRDFARQGTPIDILQVGNEITNGILWPVGQLYLPDGTQQWPAFTDLLKSAIIGAREAAGDRVRIMLHIDRGGKMGDTRWFFDNIETYGVPYDILGQSYYPMWHGSIADLEANLADSAARYAKPILLAEISYPWTMEDGDGRGNIVTDPSTLPDLAQFPATPEGQAAFYERIRQVLSAVPGSLGLGFLAWEPEWIPGVGWEPGAEAPNDNLTQFDFTGHALPSIRAYRHP